MRELEITLDRTNRFERSPAIRSALGDLALGALAAFLVGVAMGAAGCDRALVAPLSGAVGLIVTMSSLVLHLLSAFEPPHPEVRRPMDASRPDPSPAFDTRPAWRADAVRLERFLYREDFPHAYLSRERAFGFSALTGPSRGAD